MKLQEAMDFIHCTEWKGSCFGLERMKELMARLGNPQGEMRYIHVTGTNGKGSTCSMLSSILTKAGYKTGLYTSPHLFRVNERIQIDGAEIPDNELVLMAERVREAVSDMKDCPTEFEIITAMALCYFGRQNCDLVILEVGLGGRLDATNIIPAPEVAVITNVGLEHTEVLGDTVEKIAGEKAGIIKEGCDVVAYRASAAVEAVYERICREKNAFLRKVRFDKLVLQSATLSGQIFDWHKYRGLQIGLIGEHQLQNAVTALETVDVLQKRGWVIDGEAIRNGIAGAKWPARFEILSDKPMIIIDGAHNPQGIEMLIQSLDVFFPRQKVVFLAAVMADKEYETMFKSLIPYAESFVCLPIDNSRALDPKKTGALLRKLGQEAIVCNTVEHGIKTALIRAAGIPVVACGSLYMLGEVRQYFCSQPKKGGRDQSDCPRGA